jgi:MarR family transcriptional regulator, organic hydroperoxide resistance regulator
MSNDTPRLDDQLCFALYAASRAMVSAYQPMLGALGLTYPQYVVLMVLWEEDGARVSRLGERLRLDSGTLTPLLKRLEAQALVERRRSGEDERVVEIFLTPAGKRLRRKGAEVQRAILCKSALRLDELVTLREALRKLTQDLAQEAHEEDEP